MPEIANLDKLDNPVWFSLSESHERFSINYNGVKFYNPDYCPFGAFKTDNNIAMYIDEYSKLVDNFFIVGQKPMLSQLVSLNKNLVCLQMTISDRIDLQETEKVVALSDEQTNSLYELVNLVQPGYFTRRTALLGSYFGIFKNSKLVAAAGERMKMNSFVEVSAIVTHPDHTRRGYAKQLIMHTVNNIFDQNKIPYLHVAENNSKAIKLYEQLGFCTRRKISFWNITRQG